MKPLYRFMILALVGFTLGAGIAYWQAQNSEPLIQQEQINQADADVEADAAALTTAADSAMNQSANDEVVAPAGESAATASTEMAALDDASTQVMAETHADHADHAEHAAPAEHDHAAMMEKMNAAKSATPPVAGSTVGGAFSLTDHNGQAVTHESWPGKYKLVFFGFTHCPDICPAALDKMTTALNTLGDKTASIQPLFITIDPARDDAATMKAYLANYHSSIVGLTGSEEQIKQVEETYKVYAAKVDTGTPVYTMAHSSFVFLMSPNDELLEIFRDADPADQMAAKIAERVSAAQ